MAGVERESERERERDAERERESATAKIYTTIQYIQRAKLLRSTSIRLAQGWLKTFNYIHFVFVLRSHSLLTLASFVHLDSSLPPNLGSSTLPPGQNLKRFDVLSLCILPTAHFSVSRDWKHRRCIFLRRIRPLPFSIPPTQVTWHFRCLLFTLRYNCNLFLKSTNSHGPSKVNM